MSSGETYGLGFLTEEWVWGDEVVAADQDQAIAKAREMLEVVVREETPEIACVTVLSGPRKIGVWDHLDGQFVWTPET
jgi:hypothetical protein